MNINEIASERDLKFSAYDFSPYKWAYIIEPDDCSFRIIRSAIIEKIDQWYVIYSEHNSPIIQHQDDGEVISFTQDEQGAVDNLITQLNNAKKTIENLRKELSEYKDQKNWDKAVPEDSVSTVFVPAWRANVNGWE